MPNSSTHKCLIIAAGEGSRLAQLGQPKPLIKLGEMTLIERIIMLNLRSGVNEFFVVTGFRQKEIETYLHGVATSLGITVRCIYNADWRRENGLSVLAARDFLREPFFLMMADHIFDPTILTLLNKRPPRAGEIALAVDFCIRDNPHVDLDDVTKVWASGGKVLDIGKNIGRYNCYDTGLFFCTPAIFDALDQSVTIHQDTSLSGGVRQLAAARKVAAVDIGNRFWIDVDDPVAFAKAEKLVVSQNGG